MKANKELVRKYYKYSYTPDTIVPLYDSNNTNYIISDSNAFSVNSVTAWSTTQTYVLTHPILAKDITAISNVTAVQSNAGWRTTVTGITEDDESIVILDYDHGYGHATTQQGTVELDNHTRVKSITIYAYCYRRSESYCYGSINISLTYNKVLTAESTESDYDFYKDVNVYRIPKIGSIFYGITG